MYAFLQLITDGSPNKHPGKKTKQGRKRRECQQIPAKKQYVNNFWIRIVKENGVPKLTSF